MEGVTTAIVGFIFVCMALPRLVKNRPQFYAAFAAVVLIILFDTLAHLFSTTPPPDVAATTLRGFAKFSYVATGFLQVAAIVLLMLAVGGISAGEFAGELKGAYEVMRRGSEEKEVIIPMQGQMPNRPAPAPRSGPAEEHKVYTLDEAGNEIPAPPTEPPKKDDGDKGIPLV